MLTTIHFTGIETTEAIKTYALEKIQSLEKFSDRIQKIEVDIGLRTHHHKKGKIFYAEANVHVPNKLVRVVKEAEDLYKAIDKVRDHLKLELKEQKEKARRINRTVGRNKKGYTD